MSAARQLIADAHREGASFRLVGDRLRLVPDTGRDLSPALVERAKALRSEVIAILSPPMQMPSWRLQDRGERSSAPTYEAGADRKEAADRSNNLSLRKNRDAQRAGLTDRWCACGTMASYAWPVAGRETWRCLECSPVSGEG